MEINAIVTCVTDKRFGTVIADNRAARLVSIETDSERCFVCIQQRGYGSLDVAQGYRQCGQAHVRGTSHRCRGRASRSHLAGVAATSPDVEGAVYYRVHARVGAGKQEQRLLDAQVHRFRRFRKDPVPNAHHVIGRPTDEKHNNNCDCHFQSSATRPTQESQTGTAEPIVERFP